MAAMAKRASNPQEIQAIQKSLIDGVQNGSIQPHVGIPLIQDLTKTITEVKAKMAQAMTGAGMQQPQGGVPVAQQVMQQAAQESQGLEALPSNLPQEYAGGGIIAFEEGGPVERFQTGNLVGSAQVGQLGYEQLMRLFQTDPQLAKEAAVRAGPVGQRFLQAVNNPLRASALPLAVGEGGMAASMYANDVVGSMTPEQRKGMSSNPMLSAMSGDTGLAAAIQNAPGTSQPTMGYGQQMGNIFSTLGKTLVSAPADRDNPKGYGFSRLFAPDDAPAPGAASATKPPAVKPPAPVVTGEKPPAPAPGAGQKPGITSLAGPSAATLGRPGAFATPAEPSYEQSMEERTREEMLGLKSRTKTGIDELIAAQSKNKLEGKAFDDLKKNLEEEAKQAGMDKSDARAMAIFKAGLSIMGGTSRNALENIGKGAMVGAEDYQKANSELKKAEKERQKQFAAIEEARRAEDLGDMRSKNAALEKAYTANQNLDQLTTQAVLTATGKERELEGDIYKTKYAGAKGIEAAKIGADATLGAARIGADARLQTAEIKNALLTGGGKPMTRDQAYDQMVKLMDVGNPNRKVLLDEAVQSLKSSGLSTPTQAQVQEYLLQQIMGGVSLKPSTGPRTIDWNSIK
jgi:hypothetical protein